MSYKEFLEYIEDSFKKLMGKHFHIQVVTIRKNNDCKKEALLIMEGEKKVAPTIYLEEYYEDYKNGCSLGNIVSDIYGVYKLYRVRDDVSVDFINDFSKIKKCIAYKLVNRESNKDMLKEVPHFEYLDLAVIFYFIINTSGIKNATVIVQNSHLKVWNITKEVLFETAKENAPRLLPCSIENMSDVIMDYMEAQLERGTELPDKFMDNVDLIKADEGRTVGGLYVLTNSLKMNGAACILYDGVLRDFAKRMGGDIYIIPSSVHEVILLADERAEKDGLNEMIEEVNGGEVQDYNRLADHVYKYVMKEDKIVIP